MLSVFASRIGKVCEDQIQPDQDVFHSKFREKNFFHESRADVIYLGQVYRN